MRVTDAVSAVNYYMPSAKQVARSVILMSISAIALKSIPDLPVAEAGPITYSMCIACCAFAEPKVVQFCLAACAPSLGPWCP